MRWPRFLRERWERAEADARAAARTLDDAKAEQVRVRRLAAEARRLRDRNGFTEAIRQAMDVTR